MVGEEQDHDDVLIEVEAVQSVYGDDCVVIQRFPPHLRVHIKPRTADDSSQQFVEAILELRASSQYPKEPPQIGIFDSKGLDEVRQAHLITCIQEKIDELSSCLMLVALCEEAIQVLSHMNHPDGNCPLCLNSLVKEDAHGNLWPFMKLMSCYHCFHSKCIIKWWNWLQQQNSSESNDSNTRVIRSSNLARQTYSHGTAKNEGTCPVCRKVFQAMDIEHVLDLVQTYTSQMNLEETESDDYEEIQLSELENNRRKNFEALLKLQEENNGLIEPKKNQVLLPGMYLPEPITPPSASVTSPSAPTTASDLEQSTTPDNTSTSEIGASRPSTKTGTRPRRNFVIRSTRKNENKNTSSSNTSNPDTGSSRPLNRAGTSSRHNFGIQNSSTRKNENKNTSSSNTHNSEMASSRPLNRAGTSHHNNFSTRKNKTQNPSMQNKEWVQKENGTMQ